MLTDLHHVDGLDLGKLGEPVTVEFSPAQWGLAEKAGAHRKADFLNTVIAECANTGRNYAVCMGLANQLIQSFSFDFDANGGRDKARELLNAAVDAIWADRPGRAEAAERRRAL